MVVMRSPRAYCLPLLVLAFAPVMIGCRGGTAPGNGAPVASEADANGLDGATRPADGGSAAAQPDAASAGDATADAPRPPVFDAGSPTPDGLRGAPDGVVDAPGTDLPRAPDAQPASPADGGQQVSPNDAGILGISDTKNHLSVSVEASALVDDAGNAPVFPVDLLLRIVPVASYEDMPGGWQAVDGAGLRVSHATERVIEVRATSANGRPLRLRPGRALRLYSLFTFVGPAVPMHLEETARRWQPDGTIIPGNSVNSVTWNAPAFGFWSVGKNAVPHCRTGVLRNSCGEIVPNARLVVFADYYSLKNGDVAVSDGAGRFSFDRAFDDVNFDYRLRITAGNLSLRLHTRFWEAAPDCGRNGDLTFPSCDGVECYLEPASHGGGDCNTGETVCPFNWAAYGTVFCTDGHSYHWGCGGETGAVNCGCSCARDGVSVFRCDNQPVSCAQQRDLGKLCLQGPGTCGLPRYVPARPDQARACTADADCFPLLPHCYMGSCRR
jgi:hypothetical protein